ncbi:hypothetical protein LSH36_269g02003 [Paralvinella palmiformis]|uniref:Suppressor of cytokine signaling n=1 Tax=Paralvinella palmiformis TaxID=53620 RepID=A0AAD9JJK5_9ANNE|nr:hypothetical protein LSH36_269g02003 [Paralvinella palmiformis]
MTSWCPNVVYAGITDRTLLPNNMVMTLATKLHHQESGITGQLQRTRMNMKREHMAGGQMMMARPSPNPEDNHHHHHHHHHRHHHHQQHQQPQPNGHCASEEQTDVAINLVTCLPDRQDGVAQSATSACLLEQRVNRGKDSCDIKAKRVFLCVPFSINTRPCLCQTDGRHTLKADDGFDGLLMSPRSPLKRDADVGNPSERTTSPGSRSSVLSSAELQKYENIPVPGIIPRSKATSSPTPPAQAANGSRTDPITFYSRISCLGHEYDKASIIKAEHRLQASGFYYDRTSVQQAKRMLHSAEVGTFLVRISSQPSHFFALSVKTNRGTTSIRIAYDCGHFRLDADPDSVAKMPSFDCIISLIEYYVVQSASDARNRCVFLESNGRRDTPVILTRPFRDRPQSLRHLCRRNVHYHFSGSALERLLDEHSASVQVRQYLQSYPYAL